MFTDNIEPIISNEVGTIGGNNIITKSIGTVIWYWTDDDVKMHKNELNNLLYFTDSPFNIISATVLAELMKDDEGTWVLKTVKYSSFTWYFVKYKNIIFL